MSYGIVLIALIFTVYYSEGLKCYTCSVTDTEAAIDNRCITDPENVETGPPMKDCNKRYCYTLRMEYKEPKDKVSSMIRGCEDIPPCSFGIFEDSTFRYYCTSCETALCNGGDGKDPSAGSGLVADPGGYGNLRVPGTGSTNTFLPNICLLIITIVIINRMY